MSIQPSPSGEERVQSSRASLGSSAGLALLLAGITGIAAGIGGFTFRYAEGFSYLSTDPKACVNCHIMQPQFAAWEHSSHRSAAVCVDCHLPESFVPKYLAKAENGIRHGQMFTTQNFAEPIVVQKRGLQILQENCLRCHESMVHELVPQSDDPAQAVQCIHCHSGVGHVVRAGLGGPLRAHEIADDQASGDQRGRQQP